MRKIGILLAAVALGIGSVQAATPPQTTALHTELVAWQGKTDFSADYDYSSLTEVIGNYWASLSALGYSGTVTQTSQNSSTYLFTGTEGTLEAIFTLYGDRVTATLSRVSIEAS